MQSALPMTAYLPTAQLAHQSTEVRLPAAVAAIALPAGHESHAVCAGSLPNLPAGHSWQPMVSEAAATVVPILPAGHAMHVVALPYLPMVHWVQLTAPPLGWSVMLPTAQVMQSDSAFEPVALVYLPVAQSVHSVAPAPVDAAAYLPPAHVSQTAPPVPRAYLPEGHCLQKVEPTLPMYWPALHEKQSDSELALG